MTLAASFFFLSKGKESQKRRTTHKNLFLSDSNEICIGERKWKGSRKKNDKKNEGDGGS